MNTGTNADTSVLIVDDSMVIRAVVRGRLEEAGYRVLEAEDGPSCIEQCRSAPPDVVLLDVEMPGLSGHQVLAQLKGEETLRDIPVVFLTSRTGMDDILVGLRGGAHDYLKKPFEPAELVARVGAAAHVKKLQDELRTRNSELERISRTDLLTGLHNRRHLEEQLQQHSSSARRHNHSIAVLLLDIDHFKRVNDTYGHHAGDTALCEFSRRLEAELRNEDVAGRWGGEEFLVILPHTTLQSALLAGNRIRVAIASEPFHIDGLAVAVTVSGGCAAASGERPEQLVHRADTALYRAKENGRNVIIAAD